MSVGIAIRVHTAKIRKVSVSVPGFASDGAASDSTRVHASPRASHWSTWEKERVSECVREIERECV